MFSSLASENGSSGDHLIEDEEPANQQASNKANKILRLFGNFTRGLKYFIL